MTLVFMDNVLLYCYKSCWHVHTSIDVDKTFYCAICHPANSLHIQHYNLGECFCFTHCPPYNGIQVNHKGEVFVEKTNTWWTHKKIWKREARK